MPRRKAVIASPESSEDEQPTRPGPEAVSDDEEATPKRTGRTASTSKSKRRPSAPSADASNDDYTAPLNDEPSTSSRPSLRKSNSGFVEVDDRAEKLKRRRSARVSFAGQADDESGRVDGEGGGPGDNSQPEVSANTELNRSTGSRGSMRTARLSLGGSLRINAVAPAPPPAISMDVMNSNFEEWMKMATDNKINAANSWNFALIDYFHDMSLLRNTDDNTINFQKASLTLDGCVKIWTTRVDSVGTETGKLLSNLAQDNGREGDDDDDENGEDGGDGEGEEGGKKKQKVHRTEATLVKQYSQLQVKKLDLDFAVDPLFRKTRAEFDEGGATGLLLNHLGVDSKMRVVFDSGDSKITDDDEEQEESHQVIDLDHLRHNLLPPLETLEERSIAQELSEFRFSADPNNLDFTFMNKTRNDDDLNDSFTRATPNGDGDFQNHMDDENEPFNDFGFGGDDGGGGGGDFFTGDRAAGDNLAPGGPAGFAPFGIDDSGDAGHAVIGGMEPFDPRRAPNERDLVMAMNVNEGLDGDDMLDYFDASFMKNWAGPEHWKLRRTIKKPDATATTEPRARKEKSVYTIPFTSPPSKSKDELFVAASSSKIICLAEGVGAEVKSTSKPSSRSKKSKTVAKKRDNFLLPDDMHFTSQQLLRLFLKPKFTLKMRRYGIASGQLNDHGDGEVDQHFWAEANQMGGDEIDHTAGGGPIPFNTQFFQDDFDQTGFDDDEMEVDAALPMIPDNMDEEGDLLAQTQGPLKRVRPEFVNYARKAKRVDVRKLKENIWKGLKIITPKEADPEADPETVDEFILTNPSIPSTFNSVIDGLRSTYAKDKMEEISTSFCFICLLHLANERGLKIEVGGDHIIPDDEGDGGDDAEDDEIKQEERRRVGDIWSLNVYRDPSAIASA